MLVMLANRWWLVALRGLFAVLFGVVAFIWPGITLAALVLLFGAYALVDGGLALFTAIGHRDAGQPRWLLALEGLLGIATGIATFLWPGITALALLAVVAAWALLTGLVEIVAAIRLRKEIEGEWLLILSGVVSVVLGLALVIRPGAGLLALVWLAAAYAVVFGLLFIALGFRLRNWSKRGAGAVGAAIP